MQLNEKEGDMREEEVWETAKWLWILIGCAAVAYLLAWIW
jgi:hypothetical protein